MKTTAESIVEKMERTGIMMHTTMTTAERTEGLLAFQDLVLNEVFNEDHAEHLRLYDVVAHFQSLAKDKDLENDAVVLSAIRDLDMVSREISSAKSGASGEAAVAKNLRYVNRPIRTLANITMREGDVLTELDQVVITSSGILILEVKNHKGNLIINEAGQLCAWDNRPFSQKVLSERMNAKRFLLQTKLESALKQINPHLTLHIDSRVVFSHPTASVTDHCGDEPFCYGARLAKEIQHFSSHIRYSEAEMQLLAELVSGFAEAPACYDVGLDFNHIRRSFAEALVLLEEDSTTEDAAHDIEPSEPLVYRHDTAEDGGKANDKEMPFLEFSARKATTKVAITAAVAVAGGLAAVCAAVLFSRKSA